MEFNTIPADAKARVSAINGKLVLVTGGAGFLGRHIVELLLECGANVRVFDVPQCREYSAGAPGQLSFVKGDLTRLDEIRPACEGCWAVIHVASPSPLLKNPALFRAVNVGGTETVLEACRQTGIKRFVYTSSASVVFDGTDQKGLDEESKIYTNLDAYTTSKLQGERTVLKANSANLWTCAMRPHAIFGPRDPHLLTKLVQTGKGKALGFLPKSSFIIGDGNNLVDFTYVTNVAYAHILAAVSLAPNAALNGQAYFITNQEPILFWDFFNRLYVGLGYSQSWLTLPLPIMLGVGKLCDVIEKFGGKPVFTSQAVNYSGRHHYYSSDKATRHFGYRPPISMNEAVQRTVQYGKSQGMANPTPVSQEFPRPPSVYVKLMYVLLMASLFLTAAYATSGFSFLWWPLRLALLLIPPYNIARKSARFFAKQKMFTEHIPADELRGRWALVTGGTRGIGEATALGFAQRGANVLITYRDPADGDACIARLRKELERKGGADVPQIAGVQLDLSSLESVRKCVKQLQTEGRRIDWLVNNAGAMLSKGTTKDGLDRSFQTNHLGPFLLTNLMLDSNVLTETARIVNVTSIMHLWGHIAFDDLNNTKYPSTGFDAYCHAKLANILFTRELHRRRLATTRRTTLAVHPGIADSAFILHFIPKWLYRAVFFLWPLITQTPNACAQTTLYAALSKEVNTISGVYLENQRVLAASLEGRHPEVASRLWDESAKLVKYE